MIQIITRDNRRLFHHALMEMHRQRKQLFIDRMQWRLNESMGLEIDEFDSEEATYLIDVDPSGAVRQSARLLPTLAPHLMSEVFAELCDGGPPRSAHVWEASRFCPAPDTPKGGPRRDLLARMIAGILETSILFGVQKVSFVAGAALAPLAAQAGWNVRALGAKQRVGRERLTAMLADVTSDGLAAVRQRARLSGPVTRFADAGLARAA
ncbi:MAG: acyl-homoserine-lactone synthase [Terricaulis sp.]